MLIEASSALFGYGSRVVVRVPRLALRAGQCVGIFGPNGAGKTTLVRGLTGLLRPMGGEVRHAPALRFGYMPQHRAMELHWPMNGLDAAALAVSARRPLGWLGHARRDVLESMQVLGVAALAHRPFARLSGGQQQRILLAGVLAARPQVLVLDEPTDGLDVRSRDTLLELLHHLAENGLAIALISHEIEDIQFLADEVAWLHAAEDPEHPSVVELIGPEQMAQRLTHARRATA